jgi:hypothetical protein
MIWLTAAAFYLVFGAALASVIDSDEMKKPVPYADMPSIVRLGQIRITLYVFLTLVWLPLLLWKPFRLVLEEIRRGRKETKTNGS